MRITSSQNARVKLVRSLLARSKNRRQEQQFVIEGRRLVEDALAANHLPTFALYQADIEPDDPIMALVTALEGRDVACAALDPSVFSELADTESPQGILAVCDWPEHPLPEPIRWILVLDGLRNPGNLGSALRTAVAVGIDAVILTPGGVDPFNPKVVRGAMGAHFRLPVRQWDWDEIEALGLQIVVADLSGTVSLYETDLTQPTAVVIGGEAHGPRRQALQLADTVMTIPMEGGESLNAAVAASVILYEGYRQRMVSDSG